MATAQSGDDVGREVAVQVWCDHDVKLVGVGHQLHARVVDNHLLKLDVGEVLRDLAHRLEEHPVAQLHDVGFVHRGHLLTVVELRVLKCVLSGAQRLLVSDDLEALHHTLHRFMLQARVFTLSVLSDHHNVQVLEARRNAWDGEAVHEVDVHVELLAQLDVERLRVGELIAVDVRKQGALEANAVTFDGLNDVLRYIGGCLAAH
mmetsp:Transcript_27168/g.80598  ORF Transcript_27168/g.80598 Transcript_27168/m.80598 type:complete len:204 (-) Transcript_27168:462-1073(-)